MAKFPAVIYRRDGLVFHADEFVLGAGEIVGYRPESGNDPTKIDHFWITIQAGNFGLVRIAISTLSLKHLADGFDPRMRVAILPGAWVELPPGGLRPAQGLNYPEFESKTPLTYREIEREALEDLLSAQCRRAIFLEAWGVFYLRAGLGIHQVHSRRASCSVRTDYAGRDGAIRFSYREDSATEMLLFKYCGQV